MKQFIITQEQLQAIADFVGEQPLKDSLTTFQIIQAVATKEYVEPVAKKVTKK